MDGPAVVSVGLVVAIALAGGLGAVVRSLVLRGGGPTGSRTRAGRVAVVNLAGTALLAVASVLPLDPAARTVLAVGFCGSLTTFSTWVLEAANRAEGEAGPVGVAVVDLGAQLATGVLIVVAVVQPGG